MNEEQAAARLYPCYFQKNSGPTREYDIYIIGSPSRPESLLILCT